MMLISPPPIARVCPRCHKPIEARHPRRAPMFPATSPAHRSRFLPLNAGNGIQVNSSGAIQVKSNGIVVAGSSDPCCCAALELFNCSDGSATGIGVTGASIGSVVYYDGGCYTVGAATGPTTPATGSPAGVSDCATCGDISCGPNCCGCGYNNAFTWYGTITQAPDNTGINNPSGRFLFIVYGPATETGAGGDFVYLDEGGDIISDPPGSISVVCVSVACSQILDGEGNPTGACQFAANAIANVNNGYGGGFYTDGNTPVPFDGECTATYVGVGAPGADECGFTYGNLAGSVTIAVIDGYGGAGTITAVFG